LFTDRTEDDDMEDELNRLTFLEPILQDELALVNITAAAISKSDDGQEPGSSTSQKKSTRGDDDDRRRHREEEKKEQSIEHKFDFVPLASSAMHGQRTAESGEAYNPSSKLNQCKILYDCAKGMSLYDIFVYFYR
jgi:hypothetical protein